MPGDFHPKAQDAATSGSHSGSHRRTLLERFRRGLVRHWHWLGGLLVLVVVIVLLQGIPSQRIAETAQDWIESWGYWGPVALAGTYIVATVLFVPGTVLTLIAGAVYGLGLGTLIVSIGSSLGAAAAFLIARYLARHQVAKLANRNRRFAAIDQAIAEGGWKIVALLRLSPAIPFNLQNYLYGLTPIGFWPYAITSWAAMLPGTFLYVYLGTIAGAAVGGQRERTSAEWGMLGVGLLATVAVTVYVARLAKVKLEREVDSSLNSE